MMRCMGCMAEIPEGEQVCRYCGYKQGTDVKEAYYLLPGTVIGRKYTVGKVLGYGGFGVTYIGWDNVLQRKVAIKEYLPSDFATRSYGTKQLTVFSGAASQQFQAGLESFVYEAKRLAKFNSVPEIVDIYDYFKENGSGYIIMEYLEGATIKEMLKGHGRMPVDQAQKIVLEVLQGLSAVHKEGIIHRDIAPDNIFITKAGEVKILDFGAARYATAVQSRSLSVILKEGYAPEEQYRRHGKQGPWTDVYALGATFYRMITGIQPTISMQRLAKDDLRPPRELGVKIDPNVENAIMNSLNVSMEYRIQDADTFRQALQGKEPVKRVVEPGNGKIDFTLPLWMKCVLAASGVLACACIALLATGNISLGKKQIPHDGGKQALSVDECYVPNVSGMSYDEAEKLLKKKNLNAVINGINYSDSIEKNKILSQTPKDGEKASIEETVYVIMSGGSEEVMMPDLAGMEYKEAEKLLKAQNLVLKEDGVIQEYNDFVEKGRVISQNIDAEERIEVQTEISLTVSLGSLSEETAILTVPNLTGITKEKALKQLKNLKEETGFTYSIGDVKNKHSTKVEKGKIISQSLKAGSLSRTSEAIDLVISKGPQMVQVPELTYISQSRAQKRLERAGLEADVRTEYSSQVSQGLVISQGEEAGKQVAKGTKVTVVVSLGKEPVQQSTGSSSGGTSSGSTGSGSSGSSSSGGSSGGSSSGGSSGGSTSSGSSGGSSSGGSTSSGSSSGSSGSSSSGSGSSGGSSNGSGGSGVSSNGGASSGGGNAPAGSANAGSGSVVMPDGGSFTIE